MKYEFTAPQDQEIRKAFMNRRDYLIKAWLEAHNAGIDGVPAFWASAIQACNDAEISLGLVDKL